MIPPRDLRAALASVSPLRPVGASDQPACKLCAGRTRPFDLVDANKFCAVDDSAHFGLAGVGVVYFRCEDCGFVFTGDFDSWSPRDFETYIYNGDYRLIDPEYDGGRARAVAATLASRLAGLTRLSVLDYGSGQGAFEAAMRDSGFAATHGYDPFSSPARPSGRFDLICCVETIEHSPNPVATLQDIASLLAPGGLVFLQTGLMPKEIDELRGRWWYIAPRNGHVSIFGLPSLAIAARAAGLSLALGRNRETLLYRPDAPPRAELKAALAGDSWRDFLALRLSAPPPRETNGVRCLTPERWHEYETLDGGGGFRWSGADELIWEAASPGPRVELEIAVDWLAGIDGAFRPGLRLEVDGLETPLDLGGAGAPRAAVNLYSAGAAIRCTLRTPPPKTPQSLGRNADTRALGVSLRAR